MQRIQQAALLVVGAWHGLDIIVLIWHNSDLEKISKSGGNMMKSVIITIALCLLSGLLFGYPYSGGSGTEADPYQIGTKADLKYLSETSAEWSKHFVQTANIIFTEADFAADGEFYNGGQGFSPIGNASTLFTGSYNGQDRMIRGLSITRNSDNVGLFGVIRNASITNLKLFKANITGTSGVGIAIGRALGVSSSNREASVLSNISVTGVLQGLNSVGGLAGQLQNSNAVVTHCHSDVTASASSTTKAEIGSLIGVCYPYASPTISYCSARGSVTGSARSIAGLIGYLNSGSVSYSYSYTTVNGTTTNQGNIGGFIGGLNSDEGSTLVTDCYALGNVAGGTNNSGTEWHNGIGGFIGTTRIEYSGYTKAISRCYSVGSVTQTGTSSDIGGFLGRLASGSNPTVSYSYWDTQTSGRTTSAGNRGTGKTTSEMKLQSTFDTWDFGSVWALDEKNNGYPYLQYQEFPDIQAGITTPDEDVQLFSSENLNYAASQDLSQFPPFTNPDFEPVYVAVLQGSGSVFLEIETSSMWGACFYGGSWHSSMNTGGVIVFDEVDFGAKGNVAILLGNVDITLPVTLSSFTAVYYYQSNYVLLKWIAQAETDHLGYNVLRSESGSLQNALRLNSSLITDGQSLGTQVTYHYQDGEVYPNTNYHYWLESLSLSGTAQYHGPIVLNSLLPDADTPNAPIVTRLIGAYPNPFNPSTTISFGLEQAERVNIVIYNLRGQPVKSFDLDYGNAGNYSIVWDGRDNANQALSSGIYYYRMTAGKYSGIKKLILSK